MLDSDAPRATARDGDGGNDADRTDRTAHLEREVERLEAELARKDARIEAIIRRYEGLLDRERSGETERRTNDGTRRPTGLVGRLRAIFDA